jgi:uncharacterized protein YdhG (YjbR/CyaY superfamily)
MKDNQFKTVQEYIEAQPERTRRALSELRRFILEAAPGAIEMFNYNIPAFALVEGGKRDQQIMMAGYKNHVGLYPHPLVMEKFEKELDAYKRGKGSVQFPIGQTLPEDLIKRMITYRLELLKK